MTLKNWTAVIVVAFAATFHASAHAGDELGKIKFLTLRAKTGKSIGNEPTLCLLKGELRFLSSPSGETDTKQGDESAPDLHLAGNKNVLASEDRLVRDGEMLRISLSAESRELDVQLAKDGWYLTADYKSDPPEVTLSKEPTKYSRWTFIRETHGDSRLASDFYIKNENDLGKDAWLSFKKDGKRYKGGWQVHMPVLSFHDRQLFDVDDLEDGL